MTVSVPVSVTGFNNITAFSFSIEWDETVLQFDSAGAFNLQFLDGSDFGTGQVSNGILTTAWIDDNGTGKTVANGTEIFSLFFTVIGPVGSSSPIDFTDIPTSIVAAAGFPPVPLTVTTNDGSVTNGDSTAPVISCPPNTSVNTPNPSATVNGISPTASDNCGIPAVTYSTAGVTNISGNGDASGQTFNAGVTTVTYTATDGQSNTNSCNFTVTVNQVLGALSLTAHDDQAGCNDTDIAIAVTADNFDNLTALSFSMLWDPAVIGYSSITIYPNPGSPNLQHLDASDFGTAQAGSGIITMAWIDNDGSGETLADGDTLFILNFTVTGTPGDQTDIEFSDMPTSIVAGQGFPPTSIPVITQDGSASIVDDPPVFTTCPGSITLANDAGLCSAIATWTAPTANDACDGPIVPTQTMGSASGSAFPVGTTTVEFQATDSQNQTTTCSFTITVNDTEDPVLNCPADISTGTDNGVCNAVVTFSATVDDNCPGATISPDMASGSTFNLGTTTVVFTATDAAGNSATCSFNVTVSDDENPAITCPADVNANTNSGCTATGVTLGNASATDNCTANPTISNNAPATFPLGATTVTWTATDAAGNSSTCAQSVTVNDNVPPVPNLANLPNATGECSVSVTAPTATDNCAGTVTATTTDPTTYNSQGTFSITWTYDDGNGNTATQTQTVVVDDVTAPVPNVANLPNATGECSVTVTPPTATDNCGGTITGTTVDPTTYTTQGSFSIMWTYDDGNGNISVQTQAVIVDDLTAPVPDVASLPNIVGQCGAAIATAPTATDNCTGAVTGTTTDPLNYNTQGTFTVTWSYDDGNGNISTQTQTVIIADTQAPVISGCPSNITQDNDPGQCSANVSWVAPTATDNCTNPPALTSNFSPGNFPVGTTSVTYTATDAAGNASTCDFTITVEDNEPPTLTGCPGPITQNSDAGTCGAVITWTAPTTMDNCPGVTLVSTDTPGDFFAVGTTTVTYTAEDAAGNSTDCSFTVTVTDAEAPVIAGCPADFTLNNDPNECSATATWTEPTATDNCPGVSLTSNLSPGAILSVGSVTTVTYTATDAAANDATCSFEITVVDNEDPVITGCPADIVQSNDAGDCSATVTWSDPTITDNCPGATFTSSHNSGDVFPVGTTTVAYTATDAAGNDATCTFTVTVEDNEDPVVAGCPSDISQDNDTDECDAVVTWTEPTATDNCPNTTISGSHAPGDVFPVGSTTVTYTATDDAGNDAICSFTITVDDTQIPTISGCPGNLTETTDPSDCSADVTWSAPTATDNCGSATLTSSHDPGDIFPAGTTTVTYTAEDASGNTATCTFNVTVTDDEAPTLQCPADVTIEVPAGTTSTVVNNIPLFSIFDNCGVVSNGYTLTNATTGSGTGVNASGETFNLGETTVTYTAEDAAGNVGSCAFTVTVEEEDMLEITCPGNQSSVNDPGICGATFTGLDATVTPPSGLANLTYTLSGATTGNGSGNVPGSTVFNVGTTTVTYSTFNSGGSVSCSFTVTVADVEVPVIGGCPSNINTTNDPSDCGAIVNWPAPSISDNCSVLAVTVSQAPNTFFPVGTTPVEYVAVDPAGNTTQCQFSITVQDTENPDIILCPNNITVNTDPNGCTAFVTWPAPIANDNCSALLTTTHQPGSTFAVGTQTVQYKATDPAGNMDNCSFTVTVIDNQPPFIFNIPSNILAFAEPGQCGATVTWTMPGAQDNCGIESFGCNISSGTFINVTDPGNPVEVECIAVDINGNVSISMFTITVIDNTPPNFDCPANITVAVDGSTVIDPSGFLTGVQPADCDHVTLSFPDVPVTDACGIFDSGQTQGLASGADFPVGINTLEFEATDENGNTDNCNFTIEVIALEAAFANAFPTLPCEGDDVFFFVNDDYPGATYTWKDPNGVTVGSGSSFDLASIEVSQSGNFIVEIALPFCTLEATVPIQVALNPELELNANDLLCTDGSVPLDLTAADTANAGVDEWIWEFPGGTFAFGQNQTVSNANIDDAGTYTLTAITANGCVGFATIDVEISEEPMMPALFGTTSATCVGEEIVLNGQSFNGTSVSYHWFAEPATGSGLVNINNNVLSVNPAAGDFIYNYYVIVDGCSSDTASWAANVEAAPALALSVDGQTTCVDGTTSVTLMESGGNATSWMWQSQTTGFTSNEQNPVLTNVNTGTSDIYTVTASTANGCQSTASIPLTITMQPAQPAQLVASTDAICNGGTVTLTGTPYGPNATYLWTGPNLPPFPQNLSSLNVTLNQAGNFEYTFAAIVNGCPTDTVAANVLVEDTPPVNVTLTGQTQCVDGTTDVVLNSNSPNATSWEWRDENGNVLTTTETLTLTDVTSLQSGTYTVIASSSIGCNSTGSLELNITDGLPPIEGFLVGEACEEGTLFFDVTPIAGATYIWRNPAGNAFSTIQDPTIMVASTANNGNYVVTANLNGCSSADTVAVSILTAPVAENEVVVGNVNVPQSFNVIVNDQLAAGEPFNISILQQPSNGTVSIGNGGVLTYRPQAGFRENDKIFYEICYDACPDLCDIASVELQIRFPGDTCVITNVITPNDDGVNDNFVVSCLEVLDFPLNTLIVFNQWGDKVYEAAPYKNEWKGTFEGRDLPDGTYFYIFQRDPDVPAEKGFVMIYR